MFLGVLIVLVGLGVLVSVYDLLFMLLVLVNV